VVCGIAGYVAEDQRLCQGLFDSVVHLARAQGPNGEIPSNIAAIGELNPSFGKLAGRIDAGSWFVIGAVHALRAFPEADERQALTRACARTILRYDVLELNDRGLLYCPLGGDWCDDYNLDGYTLTPNLLRLWALELAASELEMSDLSGQAEELRCLIERNYWIESAAKAENAYHPRAFEREQQDAPLPYFRTSFSPAGYRRELDALANALTLLLEVGTPTARKQVSGSLKTAYHQSECTLIPAFSPTITEDAPGYATLQAMAGFEFRNRPGHYHNGGAWPMVNGWCVAGLARLGDHASAAHLQGAIEKANAKEPRYSEYLVGDSGVRGGVSPCSWSAAGELIGRAAINDRFPILARKQ